MRRDARQPQPDEQISDVGHDRAKGNEIEHTGRTRDDAQNVCHTATDHTPYPFPCALQTSILRQPDEENEGGTGQDQLQLVSHRAMILPKIENVREVLLQGDVLGDAISNQGEKK